MTKLLERFRGHRPDGEALSAYLDGRLGQTEAPATDAHLRQCAVCSARLEELRAVREALSAMPEAAAPRSFRVRAADVERAPASPAPAPWMRFAPAVSAASLVVFAVLVGVDMLRDGASDGAQSMLASGAQRSDEAIQGLESGDSATEYAYDAAPPATGEEAPAGATAPQASGTPAAGEDPAAAPSPVELGDSAARDTEPTPDPKAAMVRPAATSAADEFDAAEAQADGASTEDADDGGLSALRIGEIIAGGVALGAAAIAAGWWFRRRSEVRA